MVRLLVVVLLFSGCASRPALPPAGTADGGEEEAILGVVDRFFRAMETKDSAAFTALLTEDGLSYAQALRDGHWRLSSRANRDFAAVVVGSDAIWSERYWEPTVLVRGPVAVVWTPYEFRVDGATTHCGIDVFNLVLIDGQWRIGTAMWTIEPDACAALRPADSAAMRPN